DKFEYYRDVKEIFVLDSERKKKEEVFEPKRYTETYLKAGTKQADSELQERVQETLRQRIRNKEKYEMEKRLYELKETLRNWHPYLEEVKFVEIKEKFETLSQKGNNVMFDSDLCRGLLIKYP